MDIGVVAAFIGGTLALLSPCSALLLPAYFGTVVGSGARLVVHSLVFFVGMVAVLVPLGLGVGALAQLFNEYRTPMIIVAAIVLIVLGVLQIFGLGFDVARWIPGSDAVHERTSMATGLVKSLLLGLTSGLAGACAGPILGSVLTLAATSGSAWMSGLMMAVYGAGMVVPLFVIAMLWQRLGTRGRGVLRGRTFSVAGREFHVVSVVTGVLMIAVGVLFWTTNGLVTAPQLVPLETQMWLQTQAAALSDVWIDIIVIVAVALLLLWWWFAREKAREQERQKARQGADS